MKVPSLAHFVHSSNYFSMKETSLRLLLVVGLITSVMQPSVSQTNPLKSGTSSLLSALGAVPNLSTFTNLLKTPGLDKLLSGVTKNPFTLLAPTNDAMKKLGSAALTKLSNPSNLSQLATFVKDHIVSGKLDSKSLMASGLKAASGKLLNLKGASLGSLISGDKFNAFPIDRVLGS